MASAVGLRIDFNGAGLRRLARWSGHANQVRRLLALAVIYDGGARHEAARVGGVGMQTVRDWVLRFNAQGPDGLLDGNPQTRPTLR
jgi:transposase